MQNLLAKAGLAAMTVPQGMDYQSLDGKPSRLFFMIAAPDGANDEHLTILQKLATMIMDDDFKEALIAAKSKDEFLHIIDQKEDGKFVAQSAAAQAAPTADHIQILAVTACPTGIAHTFMAAESLEQHAKKRGITIKVETNGSGGAKNILTSDEIAKADGIIIAADKNVAMSRFDGKHVVITKVADGINKADELIDKALSGSAPVYRASGSDATEGAADVAGESIGRQIYKHLMNGVSHMLPFVVGGGILIALAFLLDDYSIDPKNFGSNTPTAKFFKDIGGAAFGFMLPVLAGFISMSIADRPGLAVGFVGGALAGTTGSGFLGALLAGFVGGWIVNKLKVVSKCLPDSLEGIKPMLIYPFFGILFMGLIMMFIIAPPVSALNGWMVDTLKNMDPSARIFMGIIVGGMMAVDMGGPINKAGAFSRPASSTSWQPSWLAAWFRRSPSPSPRRSSKTATPRASAKPVSRTTSWASRSSPRVLSRSQRLTRSASSRRSSSAPLLPAPSRWRSTARSVLRTAASSSSRPSATQRCTSSRSSSVPSSAAPSSACSRNL